jgi:hypothetical protein
MEEKEEKEEEKEEQEEEARLCSMQTTLRGSW